MSVDALRAPRPPGPLERWFGLGAILYVVLFIVGNVIVFRGTPNGDSAPQKVIRYYSDSGHRDRIVLGWAVVLLGVLCLLWFVAGLREFVRRLDGDGLLSTLTAIGGTVYATLTLAAISLVAGILTMSDDTFQHRVYPELVHGANDAGYVMHAAGGVGAAAMIIAASLTVLRAGVAPGWLGWLGVGAGIIGLFSLLFFPQAAIALWLLVAGVLLLRGGQGTQSAPR